MTIGGEGQVLIDPLFMAMKLDVRLVPEFCIQVSEGHYRPDPLDPRCHPLETVLIGELVRDEPEAQIAGTLGRERDWMAGSQTATRASRPAVPIPGSGGDYLRGYHKADEEQIARLLLSR